MLRIQSQSEIHQGPNAVSCTDINSCSPKHQQCRATECVKEVGLKEGDPCEVWGELTCGNCRELFQCDEAKRWLNIGCPDGTFCIDGYCSETDEDATCQDVLGTCSFSTNQCIFEENLCVIGQCSSVDGSCLPTSRFHRDYHPCGESDNFCTTKVCLDGVCSEVPRDVDELCGTSENECVELLCVEGECAEMPLEDGTFCGEERDHTVCWMGACVPRFDFYKCHNYCIMLGGC
eukprot:TRINITY_DN2360_c0_g3_i1.p1 TRINITY_DN2360_c0_g3~~TRINITY_DN2360_c0_g3_i1.p1  ORF type:complete len:233 (-),score=54.01 TRINITY_DN2360_c0_g3_i1:20-718(-)